MRLFEAIIEENHRAIAGDTTAGLRQSDYADSLPIAALTCIDVRLNPLIPEVLGIAEEHFIWLRNAGNIITGPQSSTMRSLSLACAVKGGKEICIIGHTDCQVCKTSTIQLLERLKDLGIQRHVLPDNVNEFYGMFGSERQNVIKACEIVRSSPLIGPKIPVHGLLLDIQTGKLEWIVNGYQAWATMSDKWNDVVRSAGETVDKLKSLADFNIGEMKFPETKIGETVTKSADWLSHKVESLQMQPASPPATESKLPGMAAEPKPMQARLVSVAEKVMDIAEAHWPKPGDQGHKTGLPPKIPTPPPIRLKQSPKQKR